MRDKKTQKKRRTARTLWQVIGDAVNFYLDNGFTNQQELLEWSRKISLAARRQLPPEEPVKKHLETIYKRLVIGKSVANYVPKDGPSKLTVDKLKPEFRAELDRRIFMSANLIKLNREEAIEKTIQRFQGWVSAIPAGGARPTDRVKRKKEITHAMPKMNYITRRVAIDQGHKLAANIKYVFAMQGNPVAFIWHSNWRRPGYDYREDHKERDELIYLVRDSWAIKEGLIKPVNGYYDEITAAGEEINCSCQVFPVYAPQKLPREFFTDKGRKHFGIE